MKYTHSSLFTDLFTKTRSTAAGFFEHYLGVHERERAPFQERSVQSIKAFVCRKTLFEIRTKMFFSVRGSALNWKRRATTAKIRFISYVMFGWMAFS